MIDEQILFNLQITDLCTTVIISAVVVGVLFSAITFNINISIAWRHKKPVYVAPWFIHDSRSEKRSYVW